ncbi:competence protein CoiA [Virgibacillus sediminis]|uniref:Competence protein CoiA n=1 Tax=Virgibacillus sediminis TaxID=202260 RepID=A0ABV7AA05_9BACI
MLQAISEQGIAVNLAACSRKEIDTWKRTGVFYCPSCSKPVIIKAGPKVIPHFAHQSVRNCPSSVGGEGMYHEKGKRLLYRWLHAQHLEVELEAYLPNIKQRPDLLLTINGRQIAMEYQCARISEKQIYSRNKGYIQKGIIPIWILGENRMKRKTAEHLQIDHFSIHLAHKFSSDFPLTLFYFCPHTLQFIMFQDIYFTSAGLAIGKFSQERLDKLRLPDIFRVKVYSQQRLFSLWKREKYRFRVRKNRQLHGKELAWHQWLYLKGKHVEQLPSLVHLPVPSQYLMNSPPWNWQSRLLIDLIAPLPQEKEFTLQHCQQFVRLNKTSPSQFPLIKTPGDPVLEYLQLLVEAGLLSQVRQGVYRKFRQVEYYSHIEQAVAGDDELMEVLSNRQKAK